MRVTTWCCRSATNANRVDHSGIRVEIPPYGIVFTIRSGNVVRVMRLSRSRISPGSRRALGVGDVRRCRKVASSNLAVPTYPEARFHPRRARPTRPGCGLGGAS